MRRFTQVFGGLAAFFRQFERRFAVSRSAPENSLALNNESFLEKHIDRIDYALYNSMYMTEMNKYRLRQHLKKYDVAYTLIIFMMSVMVLLALEARGVIS